MGQAKLCMLSGDNGVLTIQGENLVEVTEGRECPVRCGMAERTKPVQLCERHGSVRLSYIWQ